MTKRTRLQDKMDYVSGQNGSCFRTNSPVWNKGIIIPLHKKGSLSDTNNYRGITLVSCFGKIFSSILNERLQNWAKQNSANTDAQFGFKSKYSTVDAIFILNSLIERHLKGLLHCFSTFYRSFPN